jgi:hypothetical protein
MLGSYYKRRKFGKGLENTVHAPGLENQGPRACELCNPDQTAGAPGIAQNRPKATKPFSQRSFLRIDRVRWTVAQWHWLICA